MFRPSRSALLASAALALAFSAQGAYAQETSTAGAAEQTLSYTETLRSEIANLDEEIAAARAAEGTYSGGALGAIAALNTQTLELTQSVLEARLAAEETGAPIEITVPAVEPDLALADEIAAQIETQKGLVQEAKAEADGAGGLMQALALTRYGTERMTLSQLRQAWLRARYGIAFPTTGAPVAPEPVAQDEGVASADEPDTSMEDALPEWADPDYPDIDYSQPVFAGLAKQGFEISGWWGIERTRAEIDDSPQIFALNVSEWGGPYQTDTPSLKAACVEGSARLIFDADDYLLGDYNSYSFNVAVRIDEQDARTMSWSSLTSNTGAGLFDAKAEDMIRELRGAKKVFLRLKERDGEQHSLSIDLSGSEAVFKAIAEACQFSLIELSRDDYKAIQTLLNAGGFDAGTPDGVWGNGSRRAMTAYQAANGLEETGAPDEATLSAMGLDITG